MKTNLFRSCGHCWVFQIFWHIECNSFTRSSFRIWNSSTGMTLPPLALFIVMLPKAHWLHIPGCLALSEWSHCHDYLGCEDLSCIVYVYSCHLLISSGSVRSIPFLSFIVLFFAWNVPSLSWIFSKRSLVFPFYCFPLFALIAEEDFLFSLLFFGTLHSDGYIFPFLLCLLLLFFSQLFVRPLQTTILPFCISFSWGWSWSLPPIQCHEPPSIVLQALCLSDLIPWIYLSLPLSNHKGPDNKDIRT